MAVFDRNSRYVTNASTYETTDANGRRVRVLTPARRPIQTELGEHLRREGQRLDHLAGFYLSDPTAFWRICELNDAMLPDALAEAEIVKIPTVI